MILFPNAKINIGLNILEKRKDNFHNLESVFYPVQWTDALEIIPAENFEFSTSGLQVDGNPEDNLCVKVYKSLKEKYKLPPVKIHLHKNIPIGAGLGGGSSDAAFTIKLLNQLFKLGLSLEEMQAMIRPFGSDCAFFIENKPVFAHEKGDHFERIDLQLKGKFLIMIYPEIHISTKEAYDGVRPVIPGTRIKEILQPGIPLWKILLRNDFEKGIFEKYPAISKLKDELYKMGALYASMSGSGSTVYGIFEKEIPCEDLFPKKYKVWNGYLE